MSRIVPDPSFADGAAFIDGAFVPIAEARVPILDWGFLRSDATYDVVSVWNGSFFRLDAHVERFDKGLEVLQLSCGLGRAQLEGILAECVERAGLENAYVEFICTRGQPKWGSRDPRDCENAFYAFAVPYVWIATREKQETEGLHVVVSPIERISPSSVDPTVKNYHWLDFQRGLLDAFERGGETVVLVGPDGTIAEGPGFNVFSVHGDTVTTPASGVLEGITRRTAIEIAEELGLDVRRAPLTVDAVRSADELFGTSTAGGILPMTRLDGEPIARGTPGEVTMRIRERYWALHEDPAYAQKVAEIPRPALVDSAV
ncbi:MAG: aminotransferase class IV [Gaiellaceae bacterium]